MKNLYLYTLAAMAIFASCRKNDDDTGNPPPTPPGTQDSIQVIFSGGKISLSALYESFEQKTPTFVVRKGKPNKPFNYQLTGSNGLKRTIDTIAKGTGTLDANGNAALFVPALNNYKDGEITVTVTLANPDTVITAKAQKAEYEISSYLDFMRIGFYIHGDTAAHYIQTQDFAFPDTVFTSSPMSGYLYGSYDGQGHKITNLTIRSAGTPPGTTSDVGLFIASYEGSVLKNLRVELSEAGVTSTGPGNFGGLIGRLYENSTVINCSVKGKVQVALNAANAYAGGITGFAEKAKIIGCSYRGDVSGPVAGGIAGLLGNGSVINMCYAYSAFGGTNVGGIIAVRAGNVNISNCYVVPTAHTMPFQAIAPVATQVVVANCFANMGTERPGLTIADLGTINTSLAAMVINNWPVGVPQPANNKPYKSDTDLNSPMKLWWE
ncbi:GLUG motif-containing protein [Chitinophaga sp. S165]|uniref:GLUG motif-containing protein n=1 Tax=Chitinophaga sp. S165 TaxID=2135462 RepID=UPI001304F3DF|nr:GLUG motif-containing protein [Chitinophaga sp. S165]